jgi:hypothetical protein
LLEKEWQRLETLSAGEANKAEHRKLKTNKRRKTKTKKQGRSERI